MVAFLLMFGVFGPLFILPKGKQHGSFSISLFTQLYGLNSMRIWGFIKLISKYSDKNMQQLPIRMR
ncbi:MAG: hypothetical protein CW344_18220 [Parageobacillus thermoglucosidasius]|nr:hypothetical protein [Parageobacillus thermoglucosidasius]REK53255.1 MAG: hypothetical protein C6P36_17090 [Geobacillus sp.]